MDIDGNESGGASRLFEESAAFSAGGDTYHLRQEADGLYVSLDGALIARIWQSASRWRVSGIEDGDGHSAHATLSSAMMAAATRY